MRGCAGCDRDRWTGRRANNVDVDVDVDVDVNVNVDSDGDVNH
jgi:hypothetical protein